MKSKYKFTLNAKTLLAGLVLLCSGGLVACDEDIVVGGVDTTNYDRINENYGFIRDMGISRSTFAVDVWDQTQRQVYVGLTKAPETAVVATITVDEGMAALYNTANSTTYEAFPASQVTIEGNGTVTLEKWRKESSPVSMTITAGSLGKGTYVLPLKIESISEGIELSAGSDVIYYLVRVMGDVPSTAKPGGVVSICYVEVGSNNILNVGEYYLADSKIPFFDIAIIFAANINYDPVAKRPILYFNEAVKNILDNRDKYVKPLQDKGIKVLFDVLPNHYGIGWHNLTDDAARDMAAQIKAAVDFYGLDGVDFDEEWADYSPTGVSYGLPTSISTSYRRMLIEMRKLMPDKLLTVYNIGTQNFGTRLDGYSVGEIVDYSYYAYYGSFSGTPSWPGMTADRYGPAPVAFHATSGASATPSPSNPVSNTNRIVNEGYGVNLMYDLRASFNNQPKEYSPYLTQISNILYGEATVHSGIYHQVDW